MYESQQIMLKGKEGKQSIHWTDYLFMFLLNNIWEETKQRRVVEFRMWLPLEKRGVSGRGQEKGFSSEKMSDYEWWLHMYVHFVKIH